jgi:hypothetical protein
MRAALAISLALGFGLIGTPVSATCFGSDAFSTCRDDSGNSYTVRRFGNSTWMNGYNPETGSTWSQNSRTIGNTTYHNGETNGDSWNMTDHRFGSTRTFSGTDSDGNSFYYTCGPSGCTPTPDERLNNSGREDNPSYSLGSHEDNEGLSNPRMMRTSATARTTTRVSVTTSTMRAMTVRMVRNSWLRLDSVAC